MKNDMITLSSKQREALRDKRKEAGIRGDELSTAIGKGRAYISQIESGKISSVSKDMLKKIVEKLNCKINDILEADKLRKVSLSNLQRSNLRKLRESVGEVADDVSKAIGKSQSWLSQIERGRLQKVSIEDLELIAEKISCTVADILGYEPDVVENVEDYDYDSKNIYEIITENIELKRENQVLKEKLRQIRKVICQ